MKGILDIRVFDKNGKLKQHEHGENMITNFPKNAYKLGLTSPELRVLGWNEKYSGVFDITKYFNGILMFGNNLEENADNYFEQLMTSDVIGHADSLNQPYNASKYGTLDTGASVTDKNSITKVWNFGQGIASGTINSVALTTNNLGRNGLGVENISSYKSALYDEDFEKLNNMSYVCNFRKLNTPNTAPTSTDEYTNIWYLGCHNRNLYFWSYDAVDSSHIKINIYKLDLTKFYKKIDFGKYESIDTASQSADNYIYIYLDDSDLIFSETYESDIEAANQLNPSPYVYFYRGTAYFIFKIPQEVTASSYKYGFLKYNVETLEDSYITPYIDTTHEVSTAIQTGYYPDAHSMTVYDDKIYFRAYIRDSSSTGIRYYYAEKLLVYSLNLNYISTIDNVLGISNPRYIDKFGDDYVWITFSNGKSILTDFTNYKFMTGDSGGFYVSYKTVGELPSIFNDLFMIQPITASGNAYPDTIKVIKMMSGISTIKNLVNPIVKESTDSMVVTYQITKNQQ